MPLYTNKPVVATLRNLFGNTIVCFPYKIMDSDGSVLCFNSKTGYFPIPIKQIHYWSSQRKSVSKKHLPKDINYSLKSVYSIRKFKSVFFDKYKIRFKEDTCKTKSRINVVKILNQTTYQKPFHYSIQSEQNQSNPIIKYLIYCCNSFESICRYFESFDLSLNKSEERYYRLSFSGVQSIDIYGIEEKGYLPIYDNGSTMTFSNGVHQIIYYQSSGLFYDKYLFKIQSGNQLLLLDHLRFY